MTFAIAARTSEGWALASATYPMNVGHNVFAARPGVGVAVTMDYAPRVLGEACLEAMASGVDEKDAIDTIVRSDANWKRCQVSLVGTTEAATTLGPDALIYSGAIVRPDVVTAANTMRSEGVPEAMLTAWDSSSQRSVRERLQSALEAGRDAGGDLRGHNSASMMLVPATESGVIRVADVNQCFDDPIAALKGAALLDVAERRPVEHRFDLGTNAWFAYLNGEHDKARGMVAQLTDEDRHGYRGAVEYLEAAVACHFDDADAHEKSIRLFTTMPEWLEYARRGAEFSGDLSRVVDLQTLQAAQV